jgi:hypothetical protein
LFNKDQQGDEAVLMDPARKEGIQTLQREFGIFPCDPPLFGNRNAKETVPLAVLTLAGLEEP